MRRRNATALSPLFPSLRPGRPAGPFSLITLLCRLAIAELVPRVVEKYCLVEGKHIAEHTHINMFFTVCHLSTAPPELFCCNIRTLARRLRISCKIFIHSGEHGSSSWSPPARLLAYFRVSHGSLVVVAGPSFSLSEPTRSWSPNDRRMYVCESGFKLGTKTVVSRK